MFLPQNISWITVSFNGFFRFFHVIICKSFPFWVTSIWFRSPRLGCHTLRRRTKSCHWESDLCYELLQRFYSKYSTWYDESNMSKLILKYSFKGFIRSGQTSQWPQSPSSWQSSLWNLPTSKTECLKWMTGWKIMVWRNQGNFSSEIGWIICNIYIYVEILPQNLYRGGSGKRNMYT